MQPDNHVPRRAARADVGQAQFPTQCFSATDDLQIDLPHEARVEPLHVSGMHWRVADQLGTRTGEHFLVRLVDGEILTIGVLEKYRAC